VIIPAIYYGLAMNTKTIQLIAVIVLIVGAVALIYGIVSLNDYNNSAAGKIGGAARGLAGSLVGKSNVERSDIERRAITFIIAGGVGVLAGGTLFILKKKR
jgi:hypothetical protein